MKKKKNLIKRFIGYYKPHKKLFFMDISCALMIAIIDLLYPYVSRYVLQNVLPNKEYKTFVIVIVVIIVIFIIKAILEFIINYWGHMLGVRMEFDMRNELFGHLQKLSFKFYDKNRTGKIMSRVTNDLFEITELAHHGPEDLFLSLIMLVGTFIILLTIEWKLAVITYIFVPLLVIFALKQRKRMRNSFRTVKKNIANVNAGLESSISGIRVAKAFANEDYELEKFQEGNREFRSTKNIAYKNMAIFMSGIGILSNVLNVTVLGVGGLLITKNQMDVIDLLAFMLYINTFLQPVKRLSNFTQQFESGMTGFERFIEIMDEDPEIKQIHEAEELKDVKGNIKFDNVSFSYKENERKVLNNIYINIEAGSTVALVGPSGGGKTTICHLIPRFYEVEGGSISIDGKDIRNVNLNLLRKKIGIVQQDIFLFAGSIRENILYGNIEATETELVEAAKNANIHEYIISLPEGYDTVVGERGIRLSGGQKQRISIARVFLKNPPILLLDEATSALDNVTEVKIQKALARLSEGRTTLVIAHRLSTIKGADEILVIDEEGIKEKGNHDKLISEDGIYAKLYRSQFKDYILEDTK